MKEKQKLDVYHPQNTCLDTHACQHLNAYCGTGFHEFKCAKANINLLAFKGWLDFFSFSPTKEASTLEIEHLSGQKASYKLN